MQVVERNEDRDNLDSLQNEAIERIVSLTGIHTKRRGDRYSSMRQVMAWCIILFGVQIT